jgi:membrane protease YdiL (CAAX protease family)
MSRAVGMRAGGERTGSERGLLRAGYLDKSQAPLTCLLFLLPMLVLYEAGTLYFATDYRHNTEQRILAFQYMQRFFHMCGASGRYLPAMAVVTVLLSCHFTRKDRWELDFGTAGCMILESVALSLPLFVLDALSNRYIPLAAGIASGSDRWPSLAVLSIGAGIYEELVFRLVLFTLLSILLTDLLRIPKAKAVLLMVGISAVVFARYHYWGGEPFLWRTFAFRTAAGIYFGVIFLYRGFGVTSGSHAAYDLLAVTLGALSGR